MGKSLSLNRLIPLVIVAAGATFHSCKDDVFNPEIVRATYQDRFPVKDIDPSLDWKMTTEVTVNVIVYKDPETDTDVTTNYTIQIFDANPLADDSGAHLLAEGIANRNLAFSTVIDCPTAMTEVYVCRLDAQNRAIVKMVGIEGGQIQTYFGIKPVATRSASTRAENFSITTYTPERTTAEISALLSDTHTTELNEKVLLQSGEAYKISRDRTYRDEILHYGFKEDEKVATVIIDGTWAPTNSKKMKINTGVDLIVTGNGKIIIPKDGVLMLVGSSRLIVFEGGIVEGKDDDEKIDLSNASNGRYNYNAGTIKVETIQMDGDNAVLYNVGELYVEELQINNKGKLINHGEAILEETTLNSTIENGCRLKVTEKLNGNLIMGDNCSAIVESYGEDGNSGKEIKIGSNSQLTIKDNAHFSYGTTFTGPSNGYALVQIDKLKSMNGFKHAGGNIFYEVRKEEIDNNWEKKTFLHHLYNTDGVLAKWGESPILIPGGKCMGDGYTPESGTGTQTNPMKYTYVFEDNYPLVGDYDFNDIVLDVALYYKRDGNDAIPKNKIKSINIDVTLTAAGASKEIGAGLRIIGIHPSDIAEIKCKGNAESRFYNTFSGSFFMSGYGTNERWFDDDKGIIIPIFGDVHKAFMDQSDKRQLINTQHTGTNAINGAKQYTYEIEVILKDQSKSTPKFSKKDLDFFIGYRYQTMKERMEVHLYEFWGKGATKGGTIQKTNLDLAGNNTWAICVPNFRYPKELVNISISSNPEEGAYPEFLNWVKGDKDSQDWYLRPNEDKVCR